LLESIYFRSHIFDAIRSHDQSPGPAICSATRRSNGCGLYDGWELEEIFLRKVCSKTRAQPK
jgi:hypothetical protein